MKHSPKYISEELINFRKTFGDSDKNSSVSHKIKKCCFANNKDDSKSDSDTMVLANCRHSEIQSRVETPLKYKVELRPLK